MIWLGKNEPKKSKEFEVGEIDWDKWLEELSKANYNIHVNYYTTTTTTTGAIAWQQVQPVSVTNSVAATQDTEFPF